MNNREKIFLAFFSLFSAIFTLISALLFLSDSMMNGMFRLLLRTSGSARTVLFLIFILIFGLSLVSLVLTLTSGRMKRARIRSTNIGSIDIGVDAIESIALNASKASQSGVKTAKARVLPFKGDKLTIHLNITAYSDVELPAMMSKVQERVKKDIERYTGIEVAEVMVKVSRVDAIATRVDRV